jgi:regulator of protease activity HflC (stomatin/prohibitin superfamily)
MLETIILGVLVIIGGLVGLKGLTLVRDNEVGIVTKKMLGTKLPEGQIIATKGEIGVQASTLMPGLYWFMPFIWSVSKTNVISIAPRKIGIVESIDGKPIKSGRLVGDEVESNTFQDANLFLNNGGCKGIQINVMKPGTYRINTKIFTVRVSESIVVNTEQLGIVTALDGKPLPSNRVIAPAPSGGNHQYFQDGQEFINNEGYRGTQLETLQAGEYYINPLLFNVKLSNLAEVPAGYVAVIISSVGEDIEPQTTDVPKTSLDPDLNQTLVTAKETALITNKSERGILVEPVAPGRYNLNTVAYRATLVPTSAVTIKWSTEEEQGDTKTIGRNSETTDKAEEFYKYSQLRATSKDGFQLDVDVKLIIRIPPEKAPYIISRFGTVNNLIEQVVHPLIDSSFRNEAGSRGAMDFIHSRTSLQETALYKARQEFEKYHVEVQGLLVAYIKVDQALLDTQTKKQIAVQQQDQYMQEAKAQESRIAVAEQTARADKQKDIIAAKLQIDIATDNASAAIKQAEGIRDSTKIKSDGDAYSEKTVGAGKAQAYQSQVDVLGADKVAMIKIIDTIGANGIKITPDILSTGNSADGSNNQIFNLLMATMLKDQIAPKATDKI